MGNEVTEAEKNAAANLEAHLRPHVVAAWHTMTKSKAEHAIVAGYFDHAAELMGAVPGARPGAIGTAVCKRTAVLDALWRTDNVELIEPFLHIESDVIPVMLCAGTHVVMVYLHPAPADAVTVGLGGDA